MVVWSKFLSQVSGGEVTDHECSLVCSRTHVWFPALLAPLSTIRMALVVPEHHKVSVMLRFRAQVLNLLSSYNSGCGGKGGGAVLESHYSNNTE